MKNRLLLFVLVCIISQWATAGAVHMSVDSIKPSMCGDYDFTYTGTITATLSELKHDVPLVSGGLLYLYVGDGSVACYNELRPVSVPTTGGPWTVNGLFQAGILPRSINEPISIAYDSRGVRPLMITIDGLGLSYERLAESPWKPPTLPDVCGFNVPDFELDHGSLFADPINNTSPVVTTTLTVSCQQPTRVQVYVVGGATVPTNNEYVTSTILIDGQPGSNIYEIPHGKLSIDIEIGSQLTWVPNAPVSGRIQGTGIIVVEMY